MFKSVQWLANGLASTACSIESNEINDFKFDVYYELINKTPSQLEPQVGQI